MRENIYQNIDQPLNNPLDVAEKPVVKKDRRLVFLSVLIPVIVILILISIIVPLFKKSPRPTATPTPTPTPTVIPDVVNPANIIPSSYQLQFKNIEENLRYNSEILPPQIDPKLGL